MEQLLTQIGDILAQVFTIENFFNPEAWKQALSSPQVILAAFIVLNLIVFTETGLLFGFFLPGDSLLVTAGVVAYLVGWPIHVLIPLLCLAAILGDSSGYLIGKLAGPRLFRKEKSFFFRKDYLLAAQEFYTKHGGKTIVLAKFVPFIRTFAPVVAGAGKMPYRRFLAFSVCGAIGWINSMVFLGFTLHLWLDPILKPIFGPEFQIAKHIDKVIIVVVGISVLPIVLKGGRRYLAKRKSNRLALTNAPASGV